MTSPATLARAGIAERIPHSGSMCLLDTLTAWDAGAIDCLASGHSAPDHPLRGPLGLLSVCAIEYAAQAMALHGALCAAPGSEPKPGFLAVARQVNLHVGRLDDVPGPLGVRAVLVAGDVHQAQYRFEVRDSTGRLLVDGRATVVLNTPLAAP